MKVVVVNLTNKRFYAGLVSISLAILVVISTVIGVFINMYNKDIFIPTANDPVGRMVIIDAGHGGEDPGTVGVTGVLEKDLNLQIALEIGAAFENEGYVVVYTRTDDRLLYTEEENIHGIRKISDLKNRCKVADKYPNAIFISVHMNSFEKSKYSGLQVYYSEKNENSKALADSIQNKVISDLQKNNNRTTKSGKDIYILENISNNAVLIECGFLSNSQECEKLSQKEYQKELSFSIVCGIIEYIDKSES